MPCGELCSQLFPPTKELVPEKCLCCFSQWDLHFYRSVKQKVFISMRVHFRLSWDLRDFSITRAINLSSFSPSAITSQETFTLQFWELLVEGSWPNLSFPFKLNTQQRAGGRKGLEPLMPVGNPVKFYQRWRVEGREVGHKTSVLLRQAETWDLDLLWQCLQNKEILRD